MGQLLSRATDAAALVVSIFALAVAFAAMYFQSLHESSRLSMQLVDFTFEHRVNSYPVCRIDLSLSNSGNRDAALMRARLMQAATRKTSTGITTESDTYYPAGDSPGYVAQVVKGGEVKFVALVFPSCDPSSIRAALSTKGFKDFSLVTESLTHEGKLSTAMTSLAAVDSTASEKLLISLNLEGRFDLLVDRASHSGQSARDQRVLWFKGTAQKWEQGYTTTSSFRSDPPK